MTINATAIAAATATATATNSGASSTQATSNGGEFVLAANCVPTSGAANVTSVNSSINTTGGGKKNKNKENRVGSAGHNASGSVSGSGAKSTQANNQKLTSPLNSGDIEFKDDMIKK